MAGELMMKLKNSINDRDPNFRVKGKLYLVRCFSCNPERGTENWAIAVATGVCAACGWTEDREKRGK